MRAQPWLPSLMLCLPFLAPVAVAQQPYIGSFEVRLHGLDVVVTDKKGAPVSGLTKEDFVVQENGVPQTITNFSAYSSGTGRATSGRASADAGTTSPTAAAAEPPPPRRFVFFIDELAMEGTVRRKLYDSLAAMVRSMYPRDVAAVIRPTGEKNVAQEFTTNRELLLGTLRKAIDDSRVTNRTQRYMELQRLQMELQNAAFGSKVGGAFATASDTAKAAYAVAVRRRVAQRLGQIRSSVAAMRGGEERKILVLVTQGLSAEPGGEVYDYLARLERAELDRSGDRPIGTLGLAADLRPLISDIARTAAAHGVTIYALEPDLSLSGVSVGAPAQSLPRRRGEGPSVSSGLATPDPVTQRFIEESLHNSTVTLKTLADVTGGRAFRGIGEVDDTFRQLTTDLGTYYSLAYRAEGAADRPRKVTVAVRNRPELRVRTRTDVIDTSIEREMDDLVVASLLYPRQVNELGIEVETRPAVNARGYFKVPFDVKVPLDKLTFLPTTDGRYRAAFHVHFAIAGDQWDFSSGGDSNQEVFISPEQHAQRATITYRYRTAIEVPPGRMRVAVGLLDPVSKLTGFQTFEVGQPVAR